MNDYKLLSDETFISPTSSDELYPELCFAQELDMAADELPYLILGYNGCLFRNEATQLPVNLTVPDKIDGRYVTDIGDYAFCDCRELESIVLPSGIDTVGALAFMRCESLEEIIIPSGVKAIGAQAFRGCSSLKCIKLPEELSQLGTYSFADCASLTDIYYSSTRARWDSIAKGAHWSSGCGEYTVHCTDTDI